MDHTGLFHGFTAGGGLAKAVHADRHEDRRSVGCDVQNIANDSVFGDLDHIHYLRHKIEQAYYTLFFSKIQVINMGKAHKNENGVRNSDAVLVARDKN